MVPDVFAACKRFEEQGVEFVKKPDDCRMKGPGENSRPDGTFRHGGIPAKPAPSIASSPVEVFAILQKMFVNPIPTPAPVGVEYMPAGTEILRNKLEEDFAKYSPVMWADPLIIYTVKVSNRDRIEWNPAIGVDVNNSHIGNNSVLTLSAFGQQIKAIIDADLSQTGVIRAMMPAPELKYQRSIATIMHMSDMESVPTLDEAAIVRLLLLQATTVDPIHQIYTSSSVQELVVNAYVKRTGCSMQWTPALDGSDNLQIGTATETSTLYYRTIDEYASLISGNAQDSISLKTKAKTDVDISNVVFVPVKSCWRGQAWLVPYIAAFTTTAWWNHSVSVTAKYTQTNDAKTDGLSLEASFFPRASTVYIPGSYSRICLVVVDSTRATFSDAQQFLVCKGISASRAGNYDFAKQFYAYLGRRTDQSVQSMVASDITQALNHMIEFMCTRIEFRALQVRASVLSTSRFNGWGVYPCPDNPPKASGDTEDRKHIFGPLQFNSKDELKVDDYVLSDIGALTRDQSLERIKGLQSWRTDPLGYMAYGQVDCKKDDAHFPAMWSYKAGCMQYQLTESTANLRILRACGLFSQDPDSGKHILQKPVDVFNMTIAYGSLILGLSNWAHMETGVTIAEHNRLGKRWHCLPDDYLVLWPTITNDFVIRSSEYSERLVDNRTWQNYWSWFMNVYKTAHNNDNLWLDTHYSWNVPWWFVSAIAEKFSHAFKVKTGANGELIRDEDFADSDNMIGWLIEAGHSAQYDLSILTSSCQYERKVSRSKPKYFDILTPTSNGRAEAYNFLSWNMNNVVDTKKLYFRSRTTTPHPDLDGIVELNVVVFPSARIGKMRTCPRAFVGSDNRVDGVDETTYPRVSGGLKWPDPWLDWLLKGGMAEVPRLLTGDYIGAITSGMYVLMEALEAWRVSSKTDESFRDY